KGIAEKRAAPEVQPRAGRLIAANVAGLVADPIHDSDKHAVGNAVRTLDSAPGIMLRYAILFFLCGVPSDCSRVEKNVCTLKRRKPRTLGIPLVPANQCAYLSKAGVKCFETEIARSEIEFLVVEGIVRDVHLAIDALEA